MVYDASQDLIWLNKGFVCICVHLPACMHARVCVECVHSITHRAEKLAL